jgi:hypothetical protein
MSNDSKVTETVLAGDTPVMIFDNGNKKQIESVLALGTADVTIDSRKIQQLIDAYDSLTAQLAAEREKVLYWRGCAERQYEDNVSRIHYQALAENRAAAAENLVKELRDALQGVYKIPKPWISQTITWGDWDSAWIKIESALSHAKDSQQKEEQ